MNASAKRQIKGFRVSWTADHEQYWHGHGVAFTEYDECVTGCGETLREAFEDAVEQLAMDGFDNLGAFHVIHEADGTDKMMSVEQEMLEELKGQVRGSALDIDVVVAYCDAKGEHKRDCPHSYPDPREQKADHSDCEYCEGEMVVSDEDPDCAVCAGEWHFYVSIDVSVVEAGGETLESSGGE